MNSESFNEGTHRQDVREIDKHDPVGVFLNAACNIETHRSYAFGPAALDEIVCSGQLEDLHARVYQGLADYQSRS